jgi:hypothetical protein
LKLDDSKPFRNFLDVKQVRRQKDWLLWIEER